MISSGSATQTEVTSTKIELGEHERLLGGYGHLKQVNRHFGIASIGFYKTTCWFGEVPKSASDASLNVAPQLVLGEMKMLPDESTFKIDKRVTLESIDGAPSEE